MGRPAGLGPEPVPGPDVASAEGRRDVELLPAVLHAPHRAVVPAGAHPPAVPPRVPRQDPRAPRAVRDRAHAEDGPELDRAREHPPAPRPRADDDGRVPGDDVLRHRALLPSRLRRLLRRLLPLLETQPVLPLHAAVSERADALGLAHEEHVHVSDGVAGDSVTRPPHPGGSGQGRVHGGLHPTRAPPAAVREHDADAQDEGHPEAVAQGARAQAGRGDRGARGRERGGAEHEFRRARRRRRLGRAAHDHPEPREVEAGGGLGAREKDVQRRRGGRDEVHEEDEHDGRRGEGGGAAPDRHGEVADVPADQHLAPRERKSRRESHLQAVEGKQTRQAQNRQEEGGRGHAGSVRAGGERRGPREAPELQGLTKGPATGEARGVVSRN